MSELNRSQILDSLRRNAGENEQQCADRVGVSKKTISNWSNRVDTFHDRGWLKVLNAYGVDAESAKAIAESLPVLKKTAVQVETERRAAELAGNPVGSTNNDRRPEDRKPGEIKWHLDPEFYSKGTKDPAPSFDESQKTYSCGHGLILACIDALTNIGVPTTKEAICASYARNRIARTPETSAAIFKGLEDQAGMFFDLLLANGDILPDGEEVILADHVYESQIQQQTGDCRQMTVGIHPSQNNAVYLPFDTRMPIIEDLWYQPPPKIHQRKGVAMTEADIDEMYERTKMPRVVITAVDEKEVAFETDMI